MHNRERARAIYCICFATIQLSFYPASRVYSVAWLSLAFTKSFASLVRRTYKPATRLTSDSNDFLNAKSHAREKTLLAGYYHFSYIHFSFVIFFFRFWDDRIIRRIPCSKGQVSPWICRCFIAQLRM